MTNNDAAVEVQCSKWQEIEVKQINPETTKPKTRMKVTNQGERNMMTNEQVMMEVDQLLEEEHRRLMHEINKQEFYSGVLAHQQAVTKIYDRFEEEVKAQETLDEHKAYLRVIEHSQWLRERNDHLEDLLQAYREKLIEEARLDARETIFAPCN
jgi:hypothetical protein